MVLLQNENIQAHNLDLQRRIPPSLDSQHLFVHNAHFPLILNDTPLKILRKPRINQPFFKQTATAFVLVMPLL